MGNDEKKIESVKLPSGCVGLWESPTIGTKSYLYKSSANTLAQNQKVVDRENAALWWTYGKGHAVIDHAESVVPGGVWRVQDFSMDDNAVLTLADGTKKYYTCVGILRCKRGKKAYTWNGSAFAPLEKEDVVCVSCATNDGSEVYCAYFKHNFTIESRSTITSVKK